MALQYRGDDAASVAAGLQAAGIDAEVRPFFDDMAARLHDAHLVLTRAGATTIADLLVVGRPAIFVPIPQGGSREEQRGNAEALARLGAGWCMPEPDGFTAAALAGRLAQLFADATTLPRHRRRGPGPADEARAWRRGRCMLDCGGQRAATRRGPEDDRRGREEKDVLIEGGPHASSARSSPMPDSRSACGAPRHGRRRAVTRGKSRCRKSVATYNSSLLNPPSSTTCAGERACAWSSAYSTSCRCPRPRVRIGANTAQPGPTWSVRDATPAGYYAMLDRVVVCCAS